MKKEIEMYDGDCVASYEETDENKQILWDRFILFCKTHNASTGESLQNDDFNIDAPNFIADIIDEVIVFGTKWRN